MTIFITFFMGGGTCKFKNMRLQKKKDVRVQKGYLKEHTKKHKNQHHDQNNTIETFN